MNPDVVVVVVTHNSAPMIDGLLDSLRAALGGLDGEIIVVDNGSSDATREIVRRRAGCVLIEADNRGYAAGINAGVRAATSSDAILILNPDVRMDPLSIPPLLAGLELDGVGIVAPRVRSENGDLHLSLRRDPTLPRALGLSRLHHPLLSEHVQELEAYDHAHTVDWALGAVLAVSRDCAAAVGSWDESFFLYSEETDYCLRARDLGYATWYEPAATTVHIGGQSGQSDAIHTMQILNRVRLYRRNHAWIPSFVYYIATIFSELSWVLRGSSPSRAALRGLLHRRARPSQLNCSETVIPR